MTALRSVPSAVIEPDIDIGLPSEQKDTLPRHHKLCRMRPNSMLSTLTPLFAVVTLPLGILTAIFVGTLPAVAVFVVGWLLLTPATAILFGPPTAGTADGEVQKLVQERIRAERPEAVDGESSADPVEKLRERYA